MAWKQAHKLLSIRDLTDCMKYSREVVTVRVTLKKKDTHQMDSLAQIAQL